MRTDNWQGDFWAFITEAQHTPFAWGTHDCVMFAGAMVDLIKGTDFVAQSKERFPYATKDEALEVLASNGGITGIVESFLGADSHVNWGQATQGDIVLVSPIAFMTDMEMLCVHDGTQLVAPGLAGGLVAVPIRFAQYAWLIR